MPCRPRPHSSGNVSGAPTPMVCVAQVARDRLAPVFPSFAPVPCAPDRKTDFLGLSACVGSAPLARSGRALVGSEVRGGRRCGWPGRVTVCLGLPADAAEAAEAGPVESLGVSVRVRTRGRKKEILKKKTRHNNLVRSLTESAHVQSNTKCEQ